MKNKLDKYDEKILYELDNNSRFQASKLSKKIHLSKEAIIYRIKKLTSTGYIKNFQTITNASFIGYTYSWILVKLDKINKLVYQKILQYLLEKKYISNIRILEGQFDIAFLFLYKTHDEFFKQLSEFTEEYGKYIVDKRIHKLLKSYKFNLNKPKSTYDDYSCMKHDLVIDNVITKLDEKILKVLSSNSRIKILELAKKVSADPGTVRYHLKQLEKMKIIESYSITIDLEKSRSEYHKINLSLKKYSMMKKVLNFFDKYNSCMYAYELLGDYDLSIDIYVKDVYELRRLLEEFKEKFADAYLYYDVSHIVSEYKVNWSPFD
jgi:Lrp/AsnC family transcriptional regulator, leucine-responsive regulatory protein